MFLHAKKFLDKYVEDEYVVGRREVCGNVSHVGRQRALKIWLL